ncbi:MAG: AbrB/MazE/SpoVT family DNA-binding domain-containing protein [archaeon]
MYESITVVGERGQITIPKIIREKQGLGKKDKAIVKIENGRIVIEKAFGKKEREELMAEGYKKMAEADQGLEKEMRHVSKEADEMLDDY